MRFLRYCKTAAIEFELIMQDNRPSVEHLVKTQDVATYGTQNSGAGRKSTGSTRSRTLTGSEGVMGSCR